MATQTQNHVHLQGTNDRPWGAPENAPTNKYKVTQYVRQPRAAVLVEYALDNTAHVHRRTSGGNPLLFENLGHTLKVTHTELTELLTDLGRNVDFVDSYHPDDGEDHAAYVQEKVLVEVAIRNVTYDLSCYVVQITLEDVD